MVEHERRHEHRILPHDLRGRVRHGHSLAIVNISATGAMVEGGTQLRPGARIEVYLERDEWRRLVGAIVTRCVVATINAREGIIYRAGLSFTERCEWVSETATRRG